MCNSKIKSDHAVGLTEVAKFDRRPVLQPARNRIAPLESDKPLKKSFQRSLTSPMSILVTKSTNVSDFYACKKNIMTPPISPNSLNSSSEKPVYSKLNVKSSRGSRKRSGEGNKNVGLLEKSTSFKDSYSYGTTLIDRVPGSIAAAQREQASIVQTLRKMKIAHYGRTPEKLVKVVPIDAPNAASQEEKRCSFITRNSDPLYVTYHDEEWGVPVHDDKMLFELLVLSGAQVGLDWTAILKKRNDFRTAFAGFDAGEVSKFSEKQIVSISSEYGLDLGRVRGVVDNSSRILEIIEKFGSLDKFLWGFVNHKPISTDYKTCRKIPVKTSKSETISKDMVRRGFRFVGPTVIHSFMQAAGLTNDHLASCPRHHHCSSLH